MSLWMVRRIVFVSAGLFMALGSLGVGLPIGAAWAQECDGNKASTFQACHRMAESGNVAAMDQLGYMYDTGTGVRRDEREAARWYRMAAENGSALGAFNLGVQYRDGEGVPQDHREAAKWFYEAADRGQADAYYSLAQAHQEGWGVAKDPQTAATYMMKSLSTGDDFAVKEMTTNANAWSKQFRIELQRLLRDQGFYKGAIDGDFGPATKRAIQTAAESGAQPQPQSVQEASKPSDKPPEPTGPRGWLGVRIQNISDELAASIGADNIEGVLVVELADNGPAEEAGVRPGDLIFSWDGKEVTAMKQFVDMIGATPPGKMVEIKLLRNWQERVVFAKVAKFPDVPQDLFEPEPSESDDGEPVAAEPAKPTTGDQQSAQTASGTPMIVAFPELNVFTRHDVQSDHIGTLVKGDEVIAGERFTDLDAVEWARVCAGQLCGWVGAEFLAPAPDAGEEAASGKEEQQAGKAEGAEGATPAEETPESEGLGTLD